MNKLAALLLSLLLVGLFGGLAPRIALACSCAMPADPMAALQDADAVFSGEVTAARAPAKPDANSRLEYEFSVLTVWKGPVDPQAIITTHSGPVGDGTILISTCDYDFEVGRQYLVYAYADADKLRTGICMRTTLLENAAEDLAALPPGTQLAQSNIPSLPSTGGIIREPDSVRLILAGAACLLVLGYWYLARRTRRARP